MCANHHISAPKDILHHISHARLIPFKHIGPKSLDHISAVEIMV